MEILAAKRRWGCLTFYHGRDQIDVLVTRYLAGEEVLQPIQKKKKPHRKEYTVPDFDSVVWVRASDDLRHPPGCPA